MMKMKMDGGGRLRCLLQYVGNTLRFHATRNVLMATFARMQWRPPRLPGLGICTSLEKGPSRGSGYAKAHGDVHWYEGSPTCVLFGAVGSLGIDGYSRREGYLTR